MAWEIEQNYESYIAPSIEQWLSEVDEPAKSFAALVVECEYILTRHPTDLAVTLEYIRRFTERPGEMQPSLVDWIIKQRGSMTNGAHAFQIGNFEIPVCSEEVYQEYYA